MSRISPDYIKMDVDGAEESIIAGMTKTLKSPQLKSVVIEVSETSEGPITKIMQEAGFKIGSERCWQLREENYKNIIFTRN